MMEMLMDGRRLKILEDITIPSPLFVAGHRKEIRFSRG